MSPNKLITLKRDCRKETVTFFISALLIHARSLDIFRPLFDSYNHILKDFLFACHLFILSPGQTSSAFPEKVKLNNPSKDVEAISQFLKVGAVCEWIRFSVI